MIKNTIEQYNILIESRLTKLETLIISHEKTIEKIDRKFEDMDNKFNRLEGKVDKHFYWTIGLIVISMLLPYVNILLKSKGAL